MADIFPFNGIFYNQERVKDMSLVTAPPYDVISEDEQDEFYRMHEYNIIRLIFGKESPEDEQGNNRYTRAGCFLNKWLDEKVLIKDETKCIYSYSQEYSLGGVRKVQKGFICILRLEEFSPNGGVLPHEETLAGPKEDRLRLMSECHANLSPIFGLYSDPDFCLEQILRERMNQPVLAKVGMDSRWSLPRTTMRGGNDRKWGKQPAWGSVDFLHPIIDVEDVNGTVHRLWRADDSETIEKIQKVLSPQKIYIADGHHRYETALAYREMRRKNEKKFTGEEPYNHIMIYLTNMDDEGLTILPAHRLVRRLAASDSEERGREFSEPRHSLKDCPCENEGRNLKQRFVPAKVGMDSRLRGNDRKRDSLNLAHLQCERVEREGKLNKLFVRRSCSSFEEMSRLMENSPRKDNSFAMYDGDSFEFLILKDAKLRDEIMDGGIPDIYKSLDVTIVHEILLNHILNNGRKMAEDNIAYVKDGMQALRLVDEGKFALAILLNPTRIEQVRAIASIGGKMPGKATYFYPKPLSGLVVNKFY